MSDNANTIDVDAPERPLPTDEANLAALEAAAAGSGDNDNAHTLGAAADIYEDDSDGAEANKTVYILEAAFESLRSAGFSENAIKKAYASGCVDVKTATQWITMQLDHPELNTPLDPSMGRIVIKKKVILTPEQRIAKIAELKAKIASKKEASRREEKERERAAEKDRIAGGKLAMQLKEELQAKARAQAYAEQKREREEELVAKERIQLQLAIDKYIRRGMAPEEAEATAKAEFAEARRLREEATAAQMAERRAARAEAARGILSASSPQESAAAAGSSTGGGWDLTAALGAEQVAYSAAGGNVSSSAGGAAAVRSDDIEAAEPTDALPPPTVEGFSTLIEKMRGANPTGIAATLTMLKTIVGNIMQSPLDQKKRYLKASNTHYRAKVASTPYALSFLKLLGFQVGWIEVAEEASNKHLPRRQEQTVVMNTVILRRIGAALAALDAAGAV